MKRIATYSVVSIALCLLSALGVPQASTVTGRVSLGENRSSRTNADTGIVVWLKPLSPAGAASPRPRRPLPRPSIVQRDKRFETRVLAVEVGTTVDFPNKDPFFHNVFSEYDGQRFDLQLYEANTTRQMRFTKPGVCYLFCNIHSQMSAAIIVVDTPHFFVLNGPGEFRITDVPPGRYQLNVWAERCSPETLRKASRTVTVEEGSTTVGLIALQQSREGAAGHSNKYGKSYDTPVFSSPIYTQP